MVEATAWTETASYLHASMAAAARAPACRRVAGPGSACVDGQGGKAAGAACAHVGHLQRLAGRLLRLRTTEVRGRDRHVIIVKLMPTVLNIRRYAGSEKDKNTVIENVTEKYKFRDSRIIATGQKDQEPGGRGLPPDGAPTASSPCTLQSPLQRLQCSHEQTLQLRMMSMHDNIRTWLTPLTNNAPGPKAEPPTESCTETCVS